MVKLPGHVLFVCTGNTCRSPMAEYLFKCLAAKLPWQSSSAGIAAVDGLPASREAVEVMAEKNIDLKGHYSRRLTKAIFEQVDMAVVMTSAHRNVLTEAFPEASDRIFRLASFGHEGNVGDVIDPAGMSIDVYRKTRDEIENMLLDLILFLKNR